MTETSPTNRPGKTELIWLSVLLGGFFVFNLATSNLYPQVWCDEVWFSEPAVNKVVEGELHSRAFKFQPPHTFPTVNCPLYLMIQTPWLAITGTSILAVRSFNYLLMALASFLVWTIAWRFELIKSAGARLSLVVLLHLGYGMSFAYRCSRPDVIGMVTLLLLVLAFGLPRGRLRDWTILGLSAATFWIGFQVAFFAGFACCAAIFLLRGVWLRELLLVSLGLALGGCSVIAFLYWQDALDNFVPQMIGMVGKKYASGSMSFIGKLLHIVREVPGSYIDDFSTTALLLGLTGLLALGWRRLARRARGLVVFCLVLVFGTPLLFELLGHWAFYYSYLRFVPACLALFVTVSELSQTLHSPWTSIVRAAALASVALAMAVGLPMRLFLAARYSQLMPRAELQRIIQAHIKPDDIVLSDIAPFFEVKSVAKVSYCTTYSKLLVSMHVEGGHDFTPGERSAFTAMVLRTDKINAVTNHIAGQWQAVTEPFGDTQDFSPLLKLSVIGRRLASYSTQPQTQRYQLQIFRRSPGSAALQPMP